MDRSSWPAYWRALAVWAGVVAVLFAGYEVVERTALAGASDDTLRVLHLLRGATVSLAVALAVAAWLRRSAPSPGEAVEPPLPAGPAPPRPAGEPEARAPHFGWLVRLRFAALGGVAAVLVLAGPVLDRLPPGSAGPLWATAAALGAYNTFLAAAGPARSAWAGHFLAQIVLDCLALFSFAHFAGGVENPFLPFFVLHVVNAGIVLGGRAALGVLGLAAALVVGLVLGEATGALPHHCIRGGGPACAAASFDLVAAGMAGGLALTLAAASSFTRSLTGRLREEQSRLARAGAEVERERAEAEGERRKLQTIIDCMADAVVFSDPDGHVLLRNRRAASRPRRFLSPIPSASSGFRVRREGGDGAKGFPANSHAHQLARRTGNEWPPLRRLAKQVDLLANGLDEAKAQARYAILVPRSGVLKLRFRQRVEAEASTCHRSAARVGRRRPRPAPS